MRAPYQILLPLLGLFLVRVDLTDLFPLNLPVKVLKIYDGDTVLVRHGRDQLKVRISRIDSPEMGQPFLNGRGDAGAVSKNCLQKTIKLTNPKSLIFEKRDIYGRVLGDLDSLSLDLIKNGCTTIYPFATFSSKQEKILYYSALKKAKASRRGLWQYGGFKQPKMWRKISKRYVRRQSHR